MARRVYIGMGSNLGDRGHHLRQAVTAFGRIDAVALLRCSSLYDSAPLGPDQPRFLNAVVELEVGLPPQRLLCILQRIEADAGRSREARWGPRTLDLDLVLWEGRVVADPNLRIPHPEMHRRRFVLEPLAELRPDARHPVLRATVAQLLSRLPPQDVVRADAMGGFPLPLLAPELRR